jgi:hypothetical protein
VIFLPRRREGREEENSDLGNAWVLAVGNDETKESVMPRRKKTTDAIKITHERYFRGKPQMLAMLKEERAKDVKRRALTAALEKAFRKAAQLPRSLQCQLARDMIEQIEDELAHHV